MDKVKDLNVNEEQMMKDIQKGRFTLRYACIVEMIDFGFFFIKKSYPKFLVAQNFIKKRDLDNIFFYLLKKVIAIFR